MVSFPGSTTGSSASSCLEVYYIQIGHIVRDVHPCKQTQARLNVGARRKCQQRLSYSWCRGDTRHKTSSFKGEVDGGRRLAKKDQQKAKRLVFPVVPCAVCRVGAARLRKIVQKSVWPPTVLLERVIFTQFGRTQTVVASVEHLLNNAMVVVSVKNISLSTSRFGRTWYIQLYTC